MVKNLLIISSLCLLSLFATSCEMFEKKEMAKEEFVVVNVLDKKFYDDCHIDAEALTAGRAHGEASKVTSINVSMDELESYAKKNWNKDLTHLVVYCANYKCTASAESAKMLMDLGFKNVVAYEGGTAEWKQKGYPVKGDCKQGYLNDFEKPETSQEVHEGVQVVTAEQLKSLIEKFGSEKN